MIKRDFQTDKMLNGLILYIRQLDERRVPVPVGFSPNSLRVIYQLLFTNKRKYFIKHNHDLYQKSKKDLNNIYKEAMNPSNEENRFESIVFFGIIVFVIFVSSLALFLFDLSLANFLFLGFLLTLADYYLYLVWASTRGRRILAEEYDDDIKMVVQVLIVYGGELVLENGLDHEDFSIQLRHDDYDGLVYEMKGKHNFMGVFKK